MQERRNAERRRSLKAARIRFNRDWPEIECTVRNLSIGGACMDMPGEFNITLAFALTLSEERRALTCRQIWRQGNRIGVAFV